MLFKSKKPSYEHLRKKWTIRQKSSQEKFWDSHSQALKQLTIGSLGGLILLAPQASYSATPDLVSREDLMKSYDMNVLLAQQLSEIVPKDVRPLEESEEENILQTLSQNFGFKITAELNKIRLNRNYGLIGGEQHLHRYPGDNVYAHADSSIDFAKYGSAGIAPNLGAWGYFASSKEEFTQKDKMRERYYLAIQTFLVPGYAENVSQFRDFFKFRKMIVVNPRTGQAVVAIIGDAGPSEWTGKHLGGSPEVMDALGYADGPRKGSVLYFFIDDKKDEIPLGPVKVRSQE